METALTTLFALLPFVFAIYAANAAERSPNGRALALVYLAVLNAGLLFVGGMLMLVGLMLTLPGMYEAMAEQSGQAAADMARNVNWGLSGLLLLIGSALGLLALLPPIRRLAARAFDVRADSVVHAAALSLTATTLGANLAQTAMTEGLLRPELLDQIAARGTGVGYADAFVFPLLVLSLSALFGVGWLTRRTWPEVIERLGLTPPTPSQLGVGVLMTAALLALSFGGDRVWELVDAAGRDRIGGISKALLGGFTGLAGAFAVGATAAIGEELFFRGAFQPRFGVLFTSLVFALFHTQYGLTMATLIVFLVGVAIGLVRQRGAPLIVCIVIHFLYNFLGVLLGT